MADERTPIVPAPKVPGMVNINVPEGVDPEKFLKSILGFTKQVERGKQVGKAITVALGTLKKNHKDEYYNLLVAEYKKLGLDPTSLRK